MKRRFVILGLTVLLLSDSGVPTSRAGAIYYDSSPNRFGSDCQIRYDDDGAGSLDPRIPVILIHGWNPFGRPGSEGSSGWNNFIQYFNGHWDLTSNFKLYRCSYRSNADTGEKLASNFSWLMRELSDPGSPSSIGQKKFVIIAHSMGGLIARSVMEKQSSLGGSLWGERVLKVITLGTPHHGSPALTTRSWTRK